MSMRPASTPSSVRSAEFARARSSITLGASFALFCAVLLGFDTPVSQAAGGLFDILFGRTAAPAQVYYDGFAPTGRTTEVRSGGKRVRHAKRHRGHYTQARRQLTERRKFALNRHSEQRRAGPVETVPLTRASVSNASMGEAAGGASRRAVCVRACDGYYFAALPVSRAADIEAQQASCEKLCPGAEGTLFVLPSGSEKVDEARAPKSGETYAALLARLDLNDARAKSCSCQAEAGGAAASNALLADATLRPGDTVVTTDGLRILRRGSRYPFKATDFLALSEIRGISNRSALYAIDRAMKIPQGRLAVAANSERVRHGRREAGL